MPDETPGGAQDEVTGEDSAGDDATDGLPSEGGGDDTAVDDALPPALAERLAGLFGAAGGWGLLEHPRPSVRSEFEVIEASPFEQLYRCGDSGTYRTSTTRGGDFVQSSDEIVGCPIGESVYTGSFGFYESSGRGSGAGRVLTTEDAGDFVIEDPARHMSWRGSSVRRSITRAEDGSPESLSVRIDDLELVRDGTVERSVSEVRVNIGPSSAGDASGPAAVAAGDPLYLSVLLREVRTRSGDAPITLESVTELPLEGNALRPTSGQIVVTGGVNWTLQPNAQGEWQLQVGDGGGADHVLPMEEPYRFHDLSR